MCATCFATTPRSDFSEVADQFKAIGNEEPVLHTRTFTNFTDKHLPKEVFAVERDSEMREN